MTAGLFVRAAMAIDRLTGVDPHDVEPDAEVLAMPSEVVEARPVDLDGCTSCEGQGAVEQMDPVLGDWTWVTCRTCFGTGERGAA